MAFFLTVALVLAVLIEIVVARAADSGWEFQPNVARLEAERRVFNVVFDIDAIVLDPRPAARGFGMWLSKVRAKLREPRLANIAFVSKLVTHMQAVVENFAATLEVFALRALTLASALPLIGLGCIVLAVDGWVRREVRKACAGFESARIYHFAKRSLRPILLWTALGYLIAPVVVDPSWVVAALYVTVPIALGVAVSRFKKYV